MGKVRKVTAAMANPRKETEHRKADADRRDDKIPVRVTPAERAMITAGARHASVEASTWMRLLAIERCRSLGITEDTVTVPEAKSVADAAKGSKEKTAAAPRPKAKRTPRPRG